jgi:hypothetical protein
MSKIASLLGFILLFSGPLKAHQKWQEVSQEIAASHLLRKAEPVYPAFAKAAGVEGVVRIAVGIYTDGRIHSTSPPAPGGFPLPSLGPRTSRDEHHPTCGAEHDQSEERGGRADHPACGV